MNLYGSYTKMLEHSKQAMVAAIEIYNKPKFDHREEIFSILVMSAWELAILAILSKKKTRIYQPKIRGRDYQTLKIDESLQLAKKYFPKQIDVNAVVINIRALKDYRNAATHYYNEPQSKHAIYALAQASIRNYRDILLDIFGVDLANEINMVLLPLSFSNPPDFVEYFKNIQPQKYTPFIKKLLKVLSDIELSPSADTSRLVTTCTIKLETSKKISSADITASVSNDELVTINLKPTNIDDSHPFYQKDIIGDRLTTKHKNLKASINQNDFQAIIWKYDLRLKSEIYWRSKKGGSPRYSQKVISFINALSDKEIKYAKAEFNARKKRSR